MGLILNPAGQELRPCRIERESNHVRWKRTCKGRIFCCVLSSQLWSNAHLIAATNLNRLNIQSLLLCYLFSWRSNKWALKPYDFSCTWKKNLCLHLVCDIAFCSWNFYLEVEFKDISEKKHAGNALVAIPIQWVGTGISQVRKGMVRSHRLSSMKTQIWDAGPGLWSPGSIFCYCGSYGYFS